MFFRVIKKMNKINNNNNWILISTCMKFKICNKISKNKNNKLKINNYNISKTMNKFYLKKIHNKNKL